MLVDELPKGVKTIGQLTGILDDDHAVRTETLIFCLHVLQLAVDNEGNKEEADRDRELECHERVAQDGAVSAGPGGRADDEPGPEAGQVDGGVDPGQETDCYGEHEEPYIIGGQEGDGASEGRACQGAIAEKDDLDETAGDGHREDAEEHGFLEHLEDEAEAMGAKGFLKSDLFGADGRPGRYEIDIINHGKGDQQQADCAEQIHLGQVAARREVEFEIGVEIDFGERLGNKGDSLAACFPLAIGFGGPAGGIGELFADPFEPGV